MTKQRTFWQIMKRFLEPLLVSKKILGITVSYHVIYSMGKILPIFLLILSQGNYQNQVFLWGSLVYVVFGFIFSQIFRPYYWLIPAYSYLDFLTQKVTSDLIKKNNLTYESIGTGRVIAIVEKGISTWQVLLIEGEIFFISSCIISGFIFIRMSMIDYRYGLMSLILMAGILLWIIANNKKALVWKINLKEKESEHTRGLVKIFMSKFEILQNKKIRLEQSLLSRGLSEQFVLANNRNVYLARMYDIPYFGFLAGIVVIFLLQQLGVIPLSHTLLVELIGIVLLAQSMLLPFIDFIKDFSKNFTHIDKLWDFMDNTPEIEGYDTGEGFTFSQGEYDLKNLSFSYTSSAPVFTDFSLTIEGGKKTALVGRSGSGKTTLMKLLAGYMRPTGGELHIDGQDIASIRLDSYYPHIGYLTQEPSVFDGTIEENLLYGAKNTPSLEEIERAIELAECHFVYELEHGIKTEIGERGVRLSGGQKQRLAIAKIFLKNPEIILLDEPTAALDSYSEQKVASAFERLFEGRTVIVIAHRLQTVKEADDIIVLEKGAIVERGTHRQLLKLGDKYAGMVDLQSGTVKEEEED